MTKTIVDIQVVDAEKRRVPSKHYVYVIVVKWTDNSSMVVYRRYSRFFDLQTQLLDKFPIEAGSTDPSLRIIPFLPGKIFFGRSQVRDVAMKRLGEIDAYCKNLLALPPHISQCEEVLEFFEVEPDDLDPPKEDPKQKAEKKAEKISGPKQLEQFSAVADYSAQEKGEMNLQAGMIVEVTEKSESGWWFVNAEEHQGWVPSTYLQPVNGSAAGHSAPCAMDGQEEKYICIETFTADNSDEISLEKGVIVEVRQKNMDGWWIVKYQGAEGFAPATYLKKSTDPYAQALVEKSRESGVQIIGNLADVSNLMASSSSPRNSTILSSSPRSTSSLLASVAQAGKKAGDERGSGGEGEEEEEMDIVVEDAVKPKPEALSKVILKQRSLERGGSLKPPPRQNSVKQLVVSSPPPPTPPGKPSTYITISDFEDTVGDGISFTTGETITVLEKTSSGWWFVERGQDQGWVPESYLELADSSSAQVSSAVESGGREEDSDEEEEESDEEEGAQPPSASLASALSSRLKDLNGHQNMSTSSAAGPPKLPGKVTSKPPPLPGKPQDQSKSENYQEQSRDSAVLSPKEKEATSDIANALKSRFESKPPGLPSKPNEKSGPPAPPGKPLVPPASNKLSGPPAFPSKPSGAPAPPSKPSEKPEPPGWSNKPKPPGLPSKPAEKPGLPGLPKKPEKAEGSSAPGGVAGLASSLKSKFESQQQEDKPAKPIGKPSLQFSKPAPPSKSFGGSGGDSHHKPSFPKKPGGEGRSVSGQKPSLPFKNNGASGDAIRPFSDASRGSSGPPKLPFKPQVGSKPSSDSNNNTGSVNRPVSKVHSMAAAFGKQNESSNNSRPTLPVKKPTPPHVPAQKPSNKDSDIPAGKPRVGNLVNELSSKLQFGGGGGGGDSKSPEPSPVTKTGPWSAQPKDSSRSSEPLPATQFNKQKTSFQASIPKPQATSGGAEYEVIADFAAEGEGELCVQCGDVVEVLNQQQEDWWLVKLHNDQGWVPSSYLTPGPEWDD